MNKLDYIKIKNGRKEMITSLWSTIFMWNMGQPVAQSAGACFCNKVSLEIASVFVYYLQLLLWDNERVV